MKRVAHLSDLHFGTEDPEVTAQLLVDLAREKPHLVAISGDLTQRARRREFRRAKAFLDELPAPWLCVPGNHDVPFYDFFRRTFTPWKRYRRFISDELDPWYQEPGLSVLGLNSARRLVWNGGRLSHAQIRTIRRRMGRLKDDQVKALVTHHPFVPIDGSPHRDIIGRAGLALRALEHVQVDLLLAGHHHRGYSGDVRAHHTTVGRSMIVAHAGTATSRRARGEPNGYNLLHVHPRRIELMVRAWNGKRFAAHGTTHYERHRGQWLRRGKAAKLPVPL